MDRDFKLEPSPPPVSLQEVDLSQELAKLTRRRDSLTKSLNDEEDQWQIELLKRESNSHRHQQEDLLREREDMLREREDIRRREEDRRRKEEDRQRLEEESSEKSETRRRQLRLFEIRSERAQNRKKAEVHAHRFSSSLSFATNVIAGCLEVGSKWMGTRINHSSSHDFFRRWSSIGEEYTE